MGALVTTKNKSPAVAGTTFKEGENAQYLTFMLGGEMYAIDILNIKEITEYGQVTEVPMMPTFIRGVINLRGRVVPVVNLLARFGKPDTGITQRSCIVIIEAGTEGERQDIGVVVDSVSEVLDIPSSEIEPAPSFGAKIRSDFISGMGKVGGKFVVMLNVDKMLSSEEILILTNAESTVQSGGLGNG